MQKRVSYNNPIYGTNKIEYLKNYDIFVLPSFEEGDSIALKEALGSYLPVIISRQCRIDIVEKYKAGIVIETNKKSLYDSLINLKSLDLIKMGYAARGLIEEKFDNKICSKRLKDVYIDIFNGTKKSNDWIQD